MTEALARYSIGCDLLAFGRVKEAEDSFKRSLALDREAGSKTGIAWNLNQIGCLRASDGKVDEAWGLYKKALALTREAGEVRGHGITLLEMGLLRVGEGKIDEAWNLFTDSLPLQLRQGKVQDESGLAVRPNLLLAGKATVEEIRKCFEESPALNPNLTETTRSRSVTLYWLGRVFERNGHSTEALDAYEDGLELVRKTNAPDLIEVLTQSIRGVKGKVKK